MRCCTPDRLIYVAGHRYNRNTRTVKVTYDRFRNRIENRRWILFMLERLRLVALQPDPEFDAAYAREQKRKRQIKEYMFYNSNLEENEDWEVGPPRLDSEIEDEAEAA